MRCFGARTVLVTLLVLGAGGCGPRLTGIDGFWWTAVGQPGPNELKLAIGDMNGRHVWTANGYFFTFAQAETGANCRFHWEQQGTQVRYIAAVNELDYNRYIAAANVVVDGQTATLTWQMSPTFAQQAEAAWKTNHPNADPNISIATRVEAYATLTSADTMDFNGTTIATNAATGEVLASETNTWGLTRLDQCSLAFDF